MTKDQARNVLMCQNLNNNNNNNTFDIEMTLNF